MRIGEIVHYKITAGPGMGQDRAAIISRIPTQEEIDLAISQGRLAPDAYDVVSLLVMHDGFDERSDLVTWRSVAGYGDINGTWHYMSSCNQ